MFGLNAIGAQNLYPNSNPVEFTGINSGRVGAGNINGSQGTGTGKVNQQTELNEVAKIGQEKRANFENGLGGTNNPDGHKLFLFA